MIHPYLPGKYIPHFEYFPIIEKDYSEETLFEINNLASSIMVVENLRDEDKILGNLSRVIQCLREDHKDDMAMFMHWFNTMNPGKISQEMREALEKGDPQMLSEALEKMNQKWMNAGLEQGLHQGLEQGKLSEKHEVLIRQLDLKFLLSEDEKNRIRRAQDAFLLDAALDAVVTGKSKETILAGLPG